MSKERRQHERKTADEPVEIASGDKIYEATIKDISKGGASVEFRLSPDEGRARFDIGSRVEMMPETSERKSARIIREYTSGMAIRFDTPEGKD